MSTRIVTVHKDSRLRWYWEAHSGSVYPRWNGHALTRRGAYFAGWRRWAMYDRGSARRERQERRTRRTISSQCREAQS